MESNSFKPMFFINKKENIIVESLIGYVSQNEEILFYEDSNILIDQTQLKYEKVRLVCGCGSGHEPAVGGFVSEFMLKGANCDDLYSSPAYPNIQSHWFGLFSEKRYKNYGGDIIIFP